MAGFDFQMVRRFVSTLSVKGSTLSMEIYLFYNQRESESRSMENNGKMKTKENNGKQQKTKTQHCQWDFICSTIRENQRAVQWKTMEK